MTTETERPAAAIAVIDDDRSVRESLRRLLESAGHVVHAYESAEAFLADAPRPDVGCLLLDVTLPGMSGVELLGRLAAADRDETAAPAPPVVMISGQVDVPVAVGAMKSGASEFLVKPLVSDDVLTSVDRGLAEHRRRASMNEQEQEAVRRVASLTRREGEVLRLIVAGRLNKQMATELGISQKTVEFHRARVMRKLDVTCMAELMRVAFLGGVRDLYQPPVPAEAATSELVGA